MLRRSLLAATLTLNSRAPKEIKSAYNISAPDFTDGPDEDVFLSVKSVVIAIRSFYLFSTKIPAGGEASGS